MHDSIALKEYLRTHGVDNVVDLGLEELQTEYERIVREGISYYHNLLQEENSEIEFLEAKKRDVIDVLKQA